MKIYDISQELLGANTYPGDPSAQLTTIYSIDNGDAYNLSEIRACLHNGTHIDAPKHFIKGGASVDQIDLRSTVGEAYVALASGEIDENAAKRIIANAKALGEECAKRILIKGDATVTAEAARILKKAGALLVGVESQSVGPLDHPKEVHTILLGSGCILLEGIDLHGVNEGKYILFAAPINVIGAEGSLCRAVLVEL